MVHEAEVYRLVKRLAVYAVMCFRLAELGREREVRAYARRIHRVKRALTQQGYPAVCGQLDEAAWQTVLDTAERRLARLHDDYQYSRLWRFQVMILELEDFVAREGPLE